MGIYHTNPPVVLGMTAAEKAMSFLTTVAEAGLTGEQVVGTKSAAGGFASLDGATLVPLAEIPTPLTGKDADTVDSYEGALLARNSLYSVITDGSSLGFAVLPKYISIVGDNVGWIDPPVRTAVMPRAGTVRDRAAYVSANTLNAVTSIYLYEIAGAPAAAISVTAGTTGTFSVTTAFVVALGDRTYWQINSTADAGAITVDSISHRVE